MKFPKDEEAFALYAVSGTIIIAVTVLAFMIVLLLGASN